MLGGSVRPPRCRHRRHVHGQRRCCASVHDSPRHTAVHHRADEAGFLDVRGGQPKSSTRRTTTKGSTTVLVLGRVEGVEAASRELEDAEETGRDASEAVEALLGSLKERREQALAADVELTGVASVEASAEVIPAVRIPVSLASLAAETPLAQMELLRQADIVVPSGSMVSASGIEVPVYNRRDVYVAAAVTQLLRREGLSMRLARVAAELLRNLSEGQLRESILVTDGDTLRRIHQSELTLELVGSSTITLVHLSAVTRSVDRKLAGFRLHTNPNAEREPIPDSER